MTNLEAKRIDDLVQRAKSAYPDLEGHEHKFRAALAFAVNQLAKQNYSAPGAYTAEQYLNAIDASLPRKEEEPSNI
jgi:hypothetical protein